MINRLLHATLWELRIALRLGLYLPALLLAVIAAGVTSIYRCFHPSDVLAALDCGYLLLAVYLPLAFRVRGEKSQGVLLHLNLTPLRPHEYLGAKLILGLLLGVPGGALLAASAPGAWSAPLLVLLGLAGGSALMVLLAFATLASTRSAGTAWLATLVTVVVFGGPLLLELRHPWILSLFADPIRAIWMLVRFGLDKEAGGFYAWAGTAWIAVWLAVGLVVCKAAYGQARMAAPEAPTAK